MPALSCMQLQPVGALCACGLPMLSCLWLQLLGPVLRPTQMLPCRNLSDEGRYNQLPVIAEQLGLNIRDNANM